MTKAAPNRASAPRANLFNSILLCNAGTAPSPLPRDLEMNGGGNPHGASMHRRAFGSLRPPYSHELVEGRASATRPAVLVRQQRRVSGVPS
jgi:hypothetical protein